MATGMGMGGFSSKASKMKSTGVANASSSKKTSSFDVNSSLLKLERLYDELIAEANKAMMNSAIEDDDDEDSDSGLLDSITSEYMVAARYVPSSTSKGPSLPGSASISDWIPVSQMCIVRPVHTYETSTERGHSTFGLDEDVQLVISSYCREIYLAASLAAPVFNSVPRNQIQYSVEPLDSFHKYVYDAVIEGKGSKSGKGNDSSVMTKADARLILGLEEGCNDLSLIKKAYRSMSFSLHPDRFVGVERSDEEIKLASDNFARVRCAYDTLSSGIRNSDNSANAVENGTTGEVTKSGSSNSNRSWYESLGGKARNGFFGPVELISAEKAKEKMATKAYKCAVAGLNHDTVMSFVARNQAAATSR